MGLAWEQGFQPYTIYHCCQRPLIVFVRPPFAMSILSSPYSYLHHRIQSEQCRGSHDLFRFFTPILLLSHSLVCLAAKLGISTWIASSKKCVNHYLCRNFCVLAIIGHTLPRTNLVNVPKVDNSSRELSLILRYIATEPNLVSRTTPLFKMQREKGSGNTAYNDL